MKVSVIMSFTDRLRNLKNTLASWSTVDYPCCEFILVDNGSQHIDEVMSLVLDFKESTNQLVNFSRNENYIHVNKVWNRAARETSDGEYVVFAMADEILSAPDILQKMVAYGDQRCSVNTLFLSEQMTNQLDSIDWKENPHHIESLPGFWEFEDKGSMNMNKHDASLLSHVIGWTREKWDWFGWFRNNDKGHLWLDQDIVIRSRVLGIKSETVDGISCYHQWHESYMTPGWTAPGYRPVNERQARLLEESERDES